MKIQLYKPVEAEVDFSGLTLLSADEYEASKDKIQNIEQEWWLRSPDVLYDFVKCANADGSVSSGLVNGNFIFVRPALILNYRQGLEIGNKFIFENHHWTIISEKYALCDTAVRWMEFRKNWTAEDANNYEASDVKKYLSSLWAEWSTEE